MYHSKILSVRYRLVFTVAILAVLALLLFVFIQTLPKHENVQYVAPAAKVEDVIGDPLRLRVPALNTDAHIQYVGLTENGEMDVPSNIYDVAWFQLGVRPGDVGSAVIAGHLDGPGGDQGVFWDLHNLREGDDIYIEHGEGHQKHFRVERTAVYKTDEVEALEEIFGRSDMSRLNLITCNGEWNREREDYEERLVVFAVVVP